MERNKKIEVMVQDGWSVGNVVRSILRGIFCIIRVVGLRSIVNRMHVLGVEPDYLLYLEVFPHWTPVRNGVETLPICSPLGGRQ